MEAAALEGPVAALGDDDVVRAAVLARRVAQLLGGGGEARGSSGGRPFVAYVVDYLKVR